MSQPVPTYNVSDIGQCERQYKTAPEVNSYWRHKNGNVYRVTAITNTSHERPEYPPTVVYVNTENGTIWSRRVADWSRSMTRIDMPEPTAAPKREWKTITSAQRKLFWSLTKRPSEYGLMVEEKLREMNGF